jgi:hypothetical protein
MEDTYESTSPKSTLKKGVVKKTEWIVSLEHFLHSSVASFHYGVIQKWQIILSPSL